MLKYIIIIIFICFSCSENTSLEKMKAGSNKNIEMVVGYPCNNNCVWSSYAVNMNIQEGKYNCASGKCTCVKRNDVYTLCNPENVSENSNEITNNIPLLPYYNQYENKYYGSSTCQNTSIAMVLSYFEEKIYPDSIFEVWGKDIAQSPSGLNQVYSHYSRKSKIETNINASPNDLKNALLKGEIAIVHGYFTEYGHVLVVRGFDGEKYFVNDPAGKWSECFKCGYSGSTNGITSYNKRDFENAVFTSDGKSYLPGWIHTISNLQ